MIRSDQDGSALQLRDPMVLYVDESFESKEAVALLRSSGFAPFVTEDPTEPLRQKPLLLYTGACFEGLEAIRGLVRLIDHWREKGIANGVFAESR